MARPLALVMAAMGMALWLSPALAQSAPGLFQQLTQDIQTWQAALYRGLASGLRAIREDGSASALSALLGTAFLYGVLHAAGPGHGKIVLSAYLATDRRRLAEGLSLAFLSALAQAVTAILAVGILAIALGFVAQEVLGAAFWLERASYLMIAGLGVYVLARAVWPSLPGHNHGHGAAPRTPQGVSQNTAPAAGPAKPDSGHVDARPDAAAQQFCAHGHNESHSHIHSHSHAGAAAACGHDHIALPSSHGGTLGEKLAVILTIGLRPCSGALLLLIFALANGIFWAGMLGTLAMAAGTGVTVAGIALLTIAARSAAERLAGSVRPTWTVAAMRAISVVTGLLLLWVGLALAFAPPQALVPGTG